MRSIAFFLLIAAVALGCQPAETPDSSMPAPAESDFGQMPDGTAVQLYTLNNNNGMRVKITNYGATITSIHVPDKEGVSGEVTLGSDALEDYLDGHPYFGCIVGRYGNRIALGQFTLGGQTYDLAKNNGPNHLHGGDVGFDKRLWGASTFRTETTSGVEMTLSSPDGDEGYPGNLEVKVTYTLNNDNELRIDYEATTDAPTVVNLTNHTYFNLKDGGQTPVLDHEVMINADTFTPVDLTMIPTGVIAEVAGTPFDFRTPVTIGASIDQTTDEQIALGGGYDHNFVLNAAAEGMTKAAEVHDPSSGRVLEVLTEEPGVQFYTGNFLDGSETGRGLTYNYRHGFCLETQHYPDSPNQPDFPSTILNPGETYSTATVFRFSVRG